jgi:hypothetical protein
MMLDFRPVDCTTQQPLTFLPGFVNQTIYGDRLESGWSFEPYRQSYSSFWSPAAGVDGRNATCQARRAHRPRRPAMRASRRSAAERLWALSARLVFAFCQPKGRRRGLLAADAPQS